MVFFVFFQLCDLGFGCVFRHNPYAISIDFKVLSFFSVFSLEVANLKSALDYNFVALLKCVRRSSSISIPDEYAIPSSFLVFPFAVDILSWSISNIERCYWYALRCFSKLCIRTEESDYSYGWLTSHFPSFLGSDNFRHQ